jgi:hypothetical protein
VGDVLASGIPSQPCADICAEARMSSGMQGAMATATCWNSRQNTATRAKTRRMPDMVVENLRPNLTRIKPRADQRNAVALP